MRSIRSKLFLAHVLVIVIAFGMLALLLQNIVYPQFIDNSVGRQLRDRGTALATQIAPILKSGDKAQLTNALELAKASMGAEICLSDTRNKIIAHASTPATRGDDPIMMCCPELDDAEINYMIRPAAQTACHQDMLVARVPVFDEASPLTGDDQLLALDPNDGAEQVPATLAILRLRVPISEVRTAANRLEQVIFMSAFVGVLLALAVATLFSTGIAGPLQRMKTMAAEIARGKLGGRIPVKGKDEVAQLARSLNSMADQLQDSLERLEDESAKLRGVLASMADGVVAVDSGERILLANPQTFGVLNLPQSNIVGSTLNEATLPQAIIETFRTCLVDRRVAGREITTVGAVASEETNAPLEDGVAVISVLPMHLGQDEWGAVGVIHDVTESRRLEEMRRRFFSDISHELRTPLTNITGYASALEDGTASDEVTRAKSLAVILKESERLRRFIEDLLDLSRLESGAPNLQKESCDLRVLTLGVADSFGYQAGQAGVSICLDLPGDLPEVVCDPDRISQVLVNLIANAIHFNHRGGDVTLAARPLAHEVRVTVRDTGVGITADEIPYVWERFYRSQNQPPDTPSAAANGATPLSNGSGLGLAIVRSIIHAHGGRVWVESVPGKGSTFGFALPTE